ncbi:hypothetical protein CIRG_08355 [Coccidioides immitis RMSCC 2394]|uniref:Uncharacterized protein n=1 Tax=Coccidioides immitis RMSCC 2394 TaxID=404692 RepID=A0A0J6YLW2_COCIT|nr:hypothetical protein CIRG_08355 [Coccidioides immitis RMSCC 2394]
MKKQASAAKRVLPEFITVVCKSKTAGKKGERGLIWWTGGCAKRKEIVLTCHNGPRGSTQQDSENEWQALPMKQGKRHTSNKTPATHPSVDFNFCIASRSDFDFGNAEANQARLSQAENVRLSSEGN